MKNEPLADVIVEVPHGWDCSVFKGSATGYEAVITRPGLIPGSSEYKVGYGATRGEAVRDALKKMGVA